MIDTVLLLPLLLTWLYIAPDIRTIRLVVWAMIYMIKETLKQRSVRLCPTRVDFFEGHSGAEDGMWVHNMVKKKKKQIMMMMMMMMMM